MPSTLNPGLYLEVGVGANDFTPHPTMLVDANGDLPPRRFVRGARYLGVDMPLQPERSWRSIHGWFLGDPGIDEQSVEGSTSIARRLAEAREIIRRRRPGEAIDFAVADGLHLPLRDGAAREVYMANVVSSQLDFNVLEKMFREARRVLSSGSAAGQLVLRECYTAIHAPQHLPEMLMDAGFESPHYFSEGTPEYAAKVAEYGTHAYEQNFYDPNSFFVTTRPNAQIPGQSNTGGGQ